MQRDHMTRKKKALLSVVALPLIYCATYVALSAFGGHVFSQSGELRYDGGLSVSDIVVWQPYGCWYQHKLRRSSGEYGSRGNKLGYFFSPLIRIDREYMHPGKQLFDSNEFTK